MLHLMAFREAQRNYEPLSQIQSHRLINPSNRYIKELESKVATLEAELRSSDSLLPIQSQKLSHAQDAISPGICNPHFCCHYNTDQTIASQNPYQHLVTVTSPLQTTETRHRRVPRRDAAAFAESVSTATKGWRRRDLTLCSPSLNHRFRAFQAHQKSDPAFLYQSRHGLTFNQQPQSSMFFIVHRMYLILSPCPMCPQQSRLTNSYTRYSSTRKPGTVLSTGFVYTSGIRIVTEFVVRRKIAA